MNKPKLSLQTFRLRHFKAVHNSGEVRFTPLTVFIGNNGSGKSSLIEGLETLQNLALYGPDEAFLPWGGFEHVWNRAVSHQVSVVFIEELENGLDPRTIHLLVEEIRLFLQSGGQVVATTHSPYLLDLLDLSQIVVVERSRSGAPVFRRPSKRKLKEWAKKFAPGRLYTMGNLTEG